MKLRTKNTPPVGVNIPHEHFNVLIAVLNQFIETEKQIGETIYSITATDLKEKIFHFGRPYSTSDSENAVMFFFEKESAILIELLITYCGFILSPSQNFYDTLKSSHQKKKNKKGYGFSR